MFKSTRKARSIDHSWDYRQLLVFGGSAYIIISILDFTLIYYLPGYNVSFSLF